MTTPRKAVVVEDSYATAQMISLWLQRAAVEVTVVSDGNLAMSKILEIDPDIVLLDLALPGRSGWEILRELRAVEATSGLPVLVVSAHGEADWERGLIEAGADGYVPKPFKPQRLLQAVQRLLEAA